MARIVYRSGGVLFRRPRPWWKGAADVVGALVGITMLSPLFVLIAAYIKLVSPGPVFFRQQRVGYGGTRFDIWKFRTMRADADTSRHQQRTGYEIATDEPLTKLDDPQIIPLGFLLRTLCVDELPQLINVVRGEMSLIGPRPDPAYAVAHYEAWHRLRFDVLPGMTGLWQVSGKNSTTFKQMVRFDIAYARALSWRLDLKIALKTPFVILTEVRDAVLRQHTLRPQINS